MPAQSKLVPERLATAGARIAIGEVVHTLQVPPHVVLVPGLMPTQAALQLPLANPRGVRVHHVGCRRQQLLRGSGLFIEASLGQLLTGKHLVTGDPVLTQGLLCLVHRLADVTGVSGGQAVLPVQVAPHVVLVPGYVVTQPALVLAVHRTTGETLHHVW